ncbi:BON domain-containing protein [Paraburkholderia fungorum]|uniref:BON domain-containing protein n=1 Tax=Paraburkholderia fungorum TaxID=134537 RepID=UPI0038BD74EC
MPTHPTTANNSAGARPSSAGARPSSARARPISTSPRLTDSQIATEAETRLSWDAAIPKNTIKVKVSHGRIKLLGELNHEQQRTAALEDVTRLFGVTAVLDHTTIKPT